MLKPGFGVFIGSVCLLMVGCNKTADVTEPAPTVAEKQSPENAEKQSSTNGTATVAKIPVTEVKEPSPPGMVLVPAGSFTMGNTFSGEGTDNEQPVQPVDVTAFYMDQHEVTKAQWDDVYNWATKHGYAFENGGQGKGTNHPVQSVSWYNCVKWCNAKNEKENRIPAYYTSAEQTTVYRTGQIAVENDWVKWNAGYRLPTEAEWEKAARGGPSGQRFPWSNTNNITHSLANYRSSPRHPYDTSPTRDEHPASKIGDRPYTSPVGSFDPNGYGLYDMAGNVWEWCWDWFGSYSSFPTTDPHGSTLGSSRVLRGGSWDYYADGCRVAYRGSSPPTGSYSNMGFRIILPQGKSK